MSREPIYFILHCQDDTPLHTMPEAPNNIRVWRFSRLGSKNISIECNDVFVANFTFAKSSKAECADSKWTKNKVDFIKFHPRWDKTIGIRGKSL
jgi:hypothetical protein